jgi:HD superfamily phosphodiesterase
MQSFQEQIWIDFVAEQTKGRDPSHGLQHALDVRDLALRIFEHEKKNAPVNAERTLREYITIAALLHDVPDHKYDSKGVLKKKCADFIAATIDPNVSALIMQIIDCISFSKEDKIRQQCSTSNAADYAEEIMRDNLSNVEELCAAGMFIRNIVSDADKILALGAVGYDRMREFTIEMNPNFTDDELQKHMRRHAEEKLFRLVPEHFIRTEYARGIAKKEEDILRSLLGL